MRKGTAQALRVLNEAFVPDERKAEVRKRLARLKGQVEGVDRMLTQNRPCVEILTQISAAQEPCAALAESWFETIWSVVPPPASRLAASRRSTTRSWTSSSN